MLTGVVGASVVVVSTAVTLALTACWVAVSWMREPFDDLRVAAFADGVMGVDGIATAAVEVERRSRERTPVERALVHTVGITLARWRPDSMVPMLRVRTLAVAAVPWLAAALAAVWPQPSTPQTVTGGAGANVSPLFDQRTGDGEAARKIERISHLLGSEAFSQTPAVQEVARAFAELGERLARGDIPAAEAWTEIATLGAQAATALGYADDPTFRFGDGAGEADVGTGARPATDRERATPMLDDGRREEAVDAMSAPADGERVLDSLLERLEVDAIARSTPDPDADLSDVSFRPAVDPALDGLYFDNPETQAAGEAAVNTAREAGAARPDLGGAVAGDAAGLGGVDAGGLTIGIDQGTAIDRTIDPDSIALEGVALPMNEPPGSRRLQVLAAPPARPGVDDGDGVNVEPGAWRADAEAYLGGRSLLPTLAYALGEVYRNGAWSSAAE